MLHRQMTSQDLKVLAMLPQDAGTGRLCVTSQIVDDDSGREAGVGVRVLKRVCSWGFAEHDGNRPRRYARTATGMAALEHGGADADEFRTLREGMEDLYRSGRIDPLADEESER